MMWALSAASAVLGTFQRTLIGVDGKLLIVYASPSLGDVAGLPLEAILADRTGELRDALHHREMREALPASLCNPDGSPRPVLCSVAPCDGKEFGVSFFLMLR